MAWAEGITRARAIEIARDEARRLHAYLEGGMREDGYEPVTEWDPRSQERLFQREPDLAQRLQGRSYWVVYLSANPLRGPDGATAVTIGLDLYIFVERSTGAVLGHARVRD
jgi:hypothetical protein